MEEKTFAEILREEMNKEGIQNVRAASVWLRDHGASGVSFQVIAGYLNQSGCPTISRAEAMLKAFGISLNEEELKALIERSRAYCKEYREALSPVTERRMVSLHLSQLFPNLSLEEADARLVQKINNLYGEEGTLAQYVSDLIIKDFNEFLITKEE